MRISKHIRLTGTVWAAVGFLIFGVIVVVYGYGTTQRAFDWTTFLREVYSNFGIEMISIALTVIVIESLNQRRSERERKTELILQMGSPNSLFAIEAVRILRQKGWLQDGTLYRANLREANLQGADIAGAVLRDADLRFAKLQQTYAGYAVLKGAVLSSATLEASDLRCVNLRDALLTSTIFTAANLIDVDLQGAKLDKTVFDSTTTLPDGTSWAANTDLTRFTDPAHPQFWRSDYKGSPAYRGAT